MSSSEIHARSPSSAITTTANGFTINATTNNQPIDILDYKLAADFTFFIDFLDVQNTGVQIVTISSADPDS